MGVNERPTVQQLRFAVHDPQARGRLFVFGGYKTTISLDGKKVNIVFSTPESLRRGTRDLLRMIFLDHTYKLVQEGHYVLVVGLFFYLPFSVVLVMDLFCAPPRSRVIGSFRLTLGTQDRLTRFHPIAYQVTHTQESVSITDAFKSIASWITLLYGDDFLGSITHVMADMSLAIAKAGGDMWILHACWSYITFFQCISGPP